MKILKFLLPLILCVIQGCASTVKDKSSVINGSMALVKGLEMGSLKQFLAPIGSTKGIVIRQVNNSDDDSDKLEVLLPQGNHTLSLYCSYQIGGNYIESAKGDISLTVKAGHVYQLGASLNQIQNCDVMIEDLGQYNSNS